MGLGWLPDLILRCLCSKALDLKKVEGDEHEDKSNIQCLCIRVVKDLDIYECPPKDGDQNKTNQDVVIVQQPVKRSGYSICLCIMKVDLYMQMFYSAWYEAIPVSLYPRI